jgi:hypothetical protein
MAATRCLRRTTLIISLGYFALAPVLTRAADCGPTIFAYEDKVIVYTCSKAGSPEYRIIQLDDAAPLEVAGRIPVKGTRSLDVTSRYGHRRKMDKATHKLISDLSLGQRKETIG